MSNTVPTLADSPAHALVTVWPHPRVPGWDGVQPLDNPGVPLLPTVPLQAALDYEHTTDAHFSPYHVPGHSQIPRLTKAARKRQPELQIRFGVIVIDVDCADAHGGGNEDNGPAPDAWREEHRALRDDLPEALYTGMGWYETRGGYRLLWRLPELLGPDQYLSWLAGLRSDLADSGIIVDKLTDWGRCYRLPHVVRDGTRQDYPLDLRGLDEPMIWRPRTAQLAREQLAGLEEHTGPFQLPEHVADGERNKTLTSYAGKLRYAGADEQEILAALRATNTSRCDPPLEDQALERIAASVAQYPAGQQAQAPGQAPGQATDAQALPPQTPNSYLFRRGSDVEVAARALDVLDASSGAPVVADRGTLWRYDQGKQYWTQVMGDEAQRIIMRFDGEMVYKGDGDAGKVKAVPLALRHGAILGAHKCALAERAKPDYFDDAPAGLAMRDGFYTVRDGKADMLPNSPANRCMFGLPYAFQEGAKPAQFLKMLRECFQPDNDREDKIQLLREWIGVALLGQAPAYERGLILLGEGANGKSTVQRIVQAAFPADRVTAIPPQDVNQEYRRAELSTSLLNCVAEMPESDLLDSTTIKALISGDKMSARHIREAVFNFRPRAAHLYSANALPAVRDMSHGFWRRWFVLQFRRSFQPHEQDRQLADRIIREELGEVVSWCLEGAADMIARGTYTEPASATKALHSWQVEANPVAAWVEAELDEEATKRGGCFTPSAQVYQRYATWAMDNGHVRMSAIRFSKRLISLGFKPARREDARGFQLELRGRA